MQYKFLRRIKITQIIVLLSGSIFFLSAFTMNAVNVKSQIDIDTAIYLKNINYKRQLSMIKLNKLKTATIVMLGNSLTHGANWNELLGRQSVVEQGIVSDVVEGFYHRMEYVYKLNPKIVFILGGLNDVYNWIPVETIYRNYIKIINGLKIRKIIPVIQLTSYATEDYAKEWLEKTNPKINVRKYNEGRNTEIDKLNKMLRRYAKVNHIDIIDINAKTRRGHFLRKEITLDGVHFNDRGYKIWVREINKVLKKYRI